MVENLSLKKAFRHSKMRWSEWNRRGQRLHALTVPTWVKRVKQKNILAENLGQVVQDVKFEFSRTEKSTFDSHKTN